MASIDLNKVLGGPGNTDKIDVEGELSANGGLTVADGSALSVGDVAASGNATISGTLDVDGALDVGGALSVDGILRVKGLVLESYTEEISGGTLGVPTAPLCFINTEGMASSDDLNTIDATGLPVGYILMLAAADSGDTVVVKDATGNIEIAGDFSLTHGSDTITLRNRGGSWGEVCRADSRA